ncbi:MAG: chromosomal replication initiator protein DnaA [Candidatus Firestonebacteria bacterium]|nr:chromosomal replication initiator protein DnaA [Candidatus Firestonebacteria bacterium]
MEETYSNNIWEEIKKEIKKNINKQDFETWFKPTHILNEDENILNIRVPNNIFKEWLTTHYLKEIQNRIIEKKGKILEVIFISQEEEIIKKEANYIFNDYKYPEFNLNPKYKFDSFVVGNSNRFAHAASFAVAESPAKAYNPFFLYGGVGLGKTHLLHAIGHSIKEKNNKIKLMYISTEIFTNEFINAIRDAKDIHFRNKYRNIDVLLIDDIQFLEGKERTQEEFFHTFNALYDAHKQIVISSDRPPSEIATLEERLKSRFGWGLITDIQPPDLETRIAILRKKAEIDNLNIPDEVMLFIANKIKSNIRDLEGSLIRVVAYGAIDKIEITIDVAKEVLKDLINKEKEDINIEIIQEKVSKFYNINLKDFKAKKRTHTIAFPRQVAMYLSRILTDLSLPEIGSHFGGRDHTTVLFAYEKIKRLLEQDKNFYKTMEKIQNYIKE